MIALVSIRNRKGGVYIFYSSRKIKHWILTTLREKLIKIGAKVIRYARYITFQLAEVAVPRKLFEVILEKIDQLRLLPEFG